MDIQFVKDQFTAHLGGQPPAVFASPGRINLIGEHTDYNGGFVFPGAVEQGMMAAIRPNGSRVIKAYSIDLNDYDEFSLDDPAGPRASHFRYLYGVAKEMEKLGVVVEGFDTAFAGDVPLGAGMSSSAALESTYACAINQLFGQNKVSLMDMAKAGQATEHNYLGLNCGIMDQFASVHGRKGCLMRLDCRSGEFQYFPWEPKGYRLVLINSCVKHELVGSPYNDRRKSCENVVKAINEQFGMQAETLRDCTWEQIEAVRPTCNPVDIQRAVFVMGEKDRVLAVCEALEHGDYETVGQKMYETHQGLSRDYEVSCEELDFLNEVARECGVTGSRIMGGGFGGCTINLVKDELYDQFTATAVSRFAAKYGKEPVVIPVVIGDGARRLE